MAARSLHPKSSPRVTPGAPARAGVMACLVLCASAAAGAPPRPPGGQEASGPYRVSRLQPISAPTQFPGGCPGAAGDEVKPAGLVIEPAIAIDPADPRRLVATWKQDVSAEFNGRDDLVATSSDGGRTWRRSLVPGLTRCSGGTADTASDPWVSFGVGGSAWFAAQAGSLSDDPPPIAIVASHSRDGRRFGPPVTVAPPRAGNEQPAITGSSTRRGHAYLAWANFLKVLPAPAPYAIQASRTTDGGATWGPPVPVSAPGPLAIDLAPRIRELPDGALLAIFARADFGTGLAEIRVARSDDEARTWLPEVVAGAIPLPGEVFEPETGEQLPQPGYPSSAVAPDGTVYVVYENSGSASSGAIGLLRSHDGGATFRSSTLPGVTAFAWEPVVAVDSRGTVGVIWYDLRSDGPGDGATSADVWFSHSEDGGDTWRQLHVAGPTDLRTGAPPALNRFGEYQGLGGLRRGFAAVFGLASPQARNGATDIFFARIAPADEEDGEDGE